MSSTRGRELGEVRAYAAGWIFLAIFAITFPLLAFNAAPGVTFHDGGEFALASHSAGIAHSPGAPTWVILNVIFKLFTFGAEAARAANLFSALCGSLTVAFASIFVFRQLGDRSQSTRTLASGITAISLMATGAFLEQSFIAEQYTLLTAFLGAILVIIQSNDKAPKLINFLYLGVLYGLAAGNHPSQIVLGALMIAVVLQKRKDISWYKSLSVGFAGLLLGLCVYLWLPIRSAANPLMDWGNPENLNNFIASITRKQWNTRPLDAAPTGFISAWMKSYNFIGEMGMVSVFTGLVGLALSWRRAIRPAVWLVLAVVPYALILLIGHVRQDLMDLIYIRSYGVRDWHIPLYMILSMFSGLGAVWLLDLRHKTSERAQTATFATIALLIFIGLPAKLNSESLRSDQDPIKLVEDNFKLVPQNAVVAMFNDNTTNTAVYHHYVKGFRPDILPVYGMPMNAQRLSPKTGWTQQKKDAFFDDWMNQQLLNPLNQPELKTGNVKSRPLITEFTFDEDPLLAKYMIPCGYLFELRTEPVTDQQIIDAENSLRSNHKELFALPTGGETRFTREAYASAHLRRGLYFYLRNLNQIALDELKIATSWSPKNPQILFLLGCAQDNLKQYDEAEKTYLQCIDLMPDYAEVRQNLGLLYFYSKNYDRAEELVREEMTITKGKDPATQKLLQLIQEAKASFKKP